MDSPRRTHAPDEQHKRAACRAGEVLAALMNSPEGADAVADAVTAVSRDSPRIGQAVQHSSKKLLSLLQAVARQRLAAAQSGGSDSHIQSTLVFARAVQLPKREAGAARHFYVAAQRRAEDMKKHPWRYENGDQPNALPPPQSPRRATSPSLQQSARRAASPPPLSPRLAISGGGASSPAGSPRTTSPSRRDTPKISKTSHPPQQPSGQVPSSPRAASPALRARNGLELQPSMPHSPPPVTPSSQAADRESSRAAHDYAAAAESKMDQQLGAVRYSTPSRVLRARCGGTRVSRARVSRARVSRARVSRARRVACPPPSQSLHHHHHALMLSHVADGPTTSTHPSAL
jgi:hypothetical protein